MTSGSVFAVWKLVPYLFFLPLSIKTGIIRGPHYIFSAFRNEFRLFGVGAGEENLKKVGNPSMTKN